ncbi:MAG: hypothetical protein HYW63_03440 [Candidatus Levybacteria bacterium]|nr:hypothetical protein [Candidatus Levybacteria bacterium]
MRNKSISKLLTVVGISGSTYHFKKENGQINIYQEISENKFQKINKKIVIQNLVENKEDLSGIDFLSISSFNKTFMGVIGFENNFYVAKSKDGFIWALGKKLLKNLKSAYVVPEYEFEGGKVIYWSDDALHVGFSQDSTWTLYDDPIYDPRSKSRNLLDILGVFNGKDLLFVPYASNISINGIDHFSLSVALFSKQDPRRTEFRLYYPIWNIPMDLVDQIVSPIAVLEIKNKIYSFWRGKEKIYSFRHPLLEQIVFDYPKNIIAANLQKSAHNPILSPDPKNGWESLAVFNPAAYYDEDKKKLHLMYRAVGSNWRSVFGHATSDDGITINSKSNLPAYVPRSSFEGQEVMFNPNSQFTSGPGAGGCEDPRLTKIGDKVYLTYVAYDGWSQPRVGLSSIAYDDFITESWNWSPPVIISKPGVIDKNAVIFPEKIRGKYVIMHRIFPDILIDFVDSLDFDGQTFLKGEFKISPRSFGWDSRKIGAGPPPIKTKEGWLLIYHAVDDAKSHQYQIGAMILDLLDPTKVICRSSQPLISPTNWYENEGYKSGVVYPCGAALIDRKLHVYYGGADTYICVATAPFDSFLNTLKAERNHKMREFFLN